MIGKLLDIVDRLLGKEGCEWDKKQTLDTLQVYLLEEAHELIDAIDRGDGADMAEEWGDLLYNLIFLAKVGEKEGRFSMEKAIDAVAAKLIRRHPHVFGELKGVSMEEIEKNWEKIKAGEKEKESAVPADYPALARTQKKITKMRREGKIEKGEKIGEEELGRGLFELVRRAEASGLDAETILRRKMPESGS